MQNNKKAKIGCEADEASLFSICPPWPVSLPKGNNQGLGFCSSFLAKSTPAKGPLQSLEDSH